MLMQVTTLMVQAIAPTSENVWDGQLEHMLCPSSEKESTPQTLFLAPHVKTNKMKDFYMRVKSW